MEYRYQFRLPISAIEATQEQHAAQCDALGPSRCRIAGLEYHAGASRVIAASLDLRLAPEIARTFGRQSIAAVVRNGGMLTDAEISTTDVGAQLAQNDRSTAGVGDEQREVERRLAAPGLGDRERARLVERQTALRDAQRDRGNERDKAASLLAATPVHFAYASGIVDLGYADGPILGGLKDGWRNVVAGTGVLLTMVVTLLPWGVGLALLVWAWRRFGRMLGTRPGDDG